MTSDRSHRYDGWVMLGLAAAAMVGTLPGRTQGLGLVTEPLIAELQIGRVDYAQLNLWATLIGSVFALGIGWFNESILAERGFGADVYYQTLIVTAMTALVGNFGGGWLAMRVSLPRLLAGSLFVLSAGLAALPHITTIAQVMAWATAMGLGGGLVMVLFFSVWPRVYGRRHLGRIQGAAQAMTVLASAVGPLLLAWGVEVTGGYGAMFYVLAAAIAMTAAMAVVTPLPPPGAVLTADANVLAYDVPTIDARK